ncbi:adult-specific rigid cuticular protein 15.7-like [Galendromus occidentalis]|uniref:Adult-specific rigid cuticular protein 15.7-like n=1 Tax=Galendromus occidentalis TaxID=34638 RepID=A0AAJ7WJH2_9ACAR|nr:adult-specific rigid cuticular protein 15.7-like [Galendromus occidentalis]
MAQQETSSVEDVYPIGAGFERSEEKLGQQFYNPRAPGAVPKDRPQPYDFGFNIQDEYGNNQFRQETGDANGAVSGTYGYTDAFGIFRRVKYVADAAGYRAEVKSNEPGLKQESPASAVFQIDEPPQGAYVQVANGHSTSLVQTDRRVPARRFPAATSAARA